MALDPGFHGLWPTPIGLYRLPDAQNVNAVLARALQAIRLSQSAARGADPHAPFFASDDDLMRRLQIEEGQQLVKFLVESLKQTVTRANQAAWGPSRRSMRIALEGLWFQCSRAGAFHDLHTHGNCSWSGVYIVQVDDTTARSKHPTYGSANGVTRFVGPSFGHLGGAHVDLGNAYLQPPHVDIEPIPGQLVVFPASLPHQALPYDGALDRIIISFNASVHSKRGNDQLHAYGAG
jgi:uncharacterized protein (TIGR02466 family)